MRPWALSGPVVKGCGFSCEFQRSRAGPAFTYSYARTASHPASSFQLSVRHGSIHSHDDCLISPLPFALCIACKVLDAFQKTRCFSLWPQFVTDGFDRASLRLHFFFLPLNSFATSHIHFFDMSTLTLKSAALRSVARPRSTATAKGVSSLLHRKLWTSRTVITDTPEDLLSALPSDETMSKSNMAVFTLSRNIPREPLSALVKRFQDLPVPAIGCLSLGNDGNSGPFSLSYAFHESPNDKLEMVVPFRSNIQGTPKTAVGREVARTEKRLETMEWAGDDSVVPDKLPEELSTLE